MFCYILQCFLTVVTSRTKKQCSLCDVLSTDYSIKSNGCPARLQTFRNTSSLLFSSLLPIAPSFCHPNLSSSRKETPPSPSKSTETNGTPKIPRGILFFYFSILFFVHGFERLDVPNCFFPFLIPLSVSQMFIIAK